MDRWWVDDSIALAGIASSCSFALAEEWMSIKSTERIWNARPLRSALYRRSQPPRQILAGLRRILQSNKYLHTKFGNKTPVYFKAAVRIYRREQSLPRQYRRDTFIILKKKIYFIWFQPTNYRNIRPHSFQFLQSCWPLKRLDYLGAWEFGVTYRRFSSEQKIFWCMGCSWNQNRRAESRKIHYGSTE